MGGGGSTPLALPPVENLLSGDTVRVSALGSGDARSTWTLIGPAEFLVGTDSVAAQLTTPVSDALIRGNGTGSVTLNARRASNGATATAMFFVADPSHVSIRLQDTVTLRVGTQLWMVASLQDALNRYYRGYRSWVSSDTSVVALGGSPDDVSSLAGRSLIARGAGNAQVIVAFREKRDTLRVKVDP